METSTEPADATATPLGEAAIRAGITWPGRLHWARQQLPHPDAGTDDELDAWRAAMGGDDALAERLDRAGLSPDQARAALSDHAPLAQSTPEWFDWFEGCRSACCGPTPSANASDADALRWLAEREASLPALAHAIPFAQVWWPGVAAALSRLAHDHPDLVADCSPDALRDLALALLARISEVSAATLLEDMTAALTAGQRLLRRIGEVPPDPPRAAFARYCQQLAGGGLDRLLAAYPVLPSLIGTAIRQWRAATIEMLTRIDRHRHQLADLLGVSPDAPVSRVVVSAGDRHNDGRSVAIVTVEGTRFVYKPRDVRLEALWAQFVTEVSAHRAGGPVRAARVLAADDGRPYGFTECIDHVPARTPDELQRFYRNAGCTLALLHALSATDCHHENLIAHGDQLVLVDAEALFETRGTVMRPMEPVQAAGRATVLQTGMLPTWLWMEGERAALDITALGCTPATVMRGSAQGWRAVNSDAMSRGIIQVPAPRLTSLPVEPGVALDLAAHVDDLVEGFTDGYRALTSARGGALPFLLADAAHLRRRLIQRPTYVYAVLLAASREPHALRSPGARGMVLEQLVRAHLGEATWPLLAAEQEALVRLDVPLFEANLTGDATSWLDGSLDGWPGSDALAAVQARIAALDEVDLAWQVRLIRSCVAARRYRPTDPASGDDPAEHRPPASAPTGESAHRLGERVRRRVVADALVTGRDATWMTVALLPDGERANVQRIGTGLYDGALGIALALHEAGEHDLARSAVSALFQELDSADPARLRRQLLAIGLGWSGASGYLRALRVLERRGHLDAQQAGARIAAVVSGLSEEAIARDRWLDLMNGAAGLIAPLAAEVQRSSWTDAQRARIASLIERAADHLVARQRADGGWTTLPGSAPLTGLAHGASGIAVALAEAAAVLGTGRHLEAAVRGLRYEATAFDAEAGNWPDFRTSATSGFMLGWCAGAPGIALARLRMLDLLPDHPDAPAWQVELERAATTTAEAPLLHRDHLCCGNLGRAAILQVLADRTSRPAWRAAGERLVDAVAARASGSLPASFLGRPTPGVLAVPGLMTGLSGCALVLAGQPDQAWLTDLLL